MAIKSTLKISLKKRDAERGTSNLGGTLMEGRPSDNLVGLAAVKNAMPKKRREKAEVEMRLTTS